MPETQMYEEVRKVADTRSMLAGRVGDTPWTTFERDLAHCWPLIFGEATALTQEIMKAQYGDEELYSEAMRHLDTYSKFYIHVYADALVDRKEGIGAFGQLYKYIREEGELAQAVYSTFTASIGQSIPSYLFTAQAMALSIPRAIDQTAFDLTAMTSIMHSLSDSTRRLVMKELAEQGEWPTNISYSGILKRTEDYMAMIKKEQEGQIQAMKDKAAKAEAK